MSSQWAINLRHLPWHYNDIWNKTIGPNKPWLSLAAAYIIRERNYLYERKLPGKDKLRLEKAVNADFVPFIRGVRVLCKPRPE